MALNNEKIKSIRPLQDRILIEKITENESTTPGGIFIPEVAKEKPQIGKVIAVGNGKILNNGVFFYNYHLNCEVEYIKIKSDVSIGNR